MWYLINVIQLILIGFWTLVSGLTGMLLFAVTRRQQPMFWVARSMWSPVVLFLGGARLKVTGLEHFDGNQSFIYVSNHESFMDIPAIFRAVPTALRFIAKKELKKMPIVGAYMKISGMIYVDRQNREKAMESMREAGEKIRDGKDVISFAEGTRSKSGSVGVFKRGSFFIAREAQVDVMPIAVRGTKEVWNGLRLRPGTIQVQLGAPFRAADYRERKEEEFAADVRNEVVRMRDALATETA